MAKKLVYNYTFTPGSAGVGTIEMDGKWVERSLLLITNVTDNIIIYNFAGSGLGGTTSYTSSTNKTVLTLDYDTSSMSASDELQIFVDQQHDDIEFSETFTDPVFKLRVSNPENLIDTDFEYGLQSSKWETVELVNNLPSVYTSGSGVSIGGIASVDSTSNTRLIRVVCTVPHELSLGTPIEVQGCTSRTANGKYIVTNIESTLIFSYQASSVQATTKNIKTSYTTIIPGAFFTSSDIQYNINESISTDNGDPSTLTFTTNYNHGFTTTTSLYITNTVGKRSYTLTNVSDTAPDGLPYVKTGTATTIDSSLYIPQHKLYENQRFYITANSPAALPSTLSGAPEPTTSSTCQGVYNSVNIACETIRSTLSAQGNASRLLMSSPAGNSSNYPMYCDAFSSTTSASSGSATLTDTQYQYLQYGDYGLNYTLYMRLYRNNSTSTYTEYQWQGMIGEGSPLLLNGTPVDVGAYWIRTFGSYGDNTLANKGLFWCSTPYSFNSYTNALVTVRQFPKPSILAAGDTSHTGTYYFDFSFYTKRTLAQYTSYTTTQSNARISAGGGWLYTYYSTYQLPNNPPYMGYISIYINLENTNWSGYNGNYNQLWYGQYYNAQTLYGQMTEHIGAYYRIEVLIPIDDDTPAGRYGTSGTVLTTAQMVSTIVNQVIADNAYPSFNSQTGINTVYAGVVDSNRINLKNANGQKYYFSNQGTGPFSLETDQTVGVVDDYYNISGVTSTTVSIASSNQISPRVLTFNSTTGIQTFSSIPYIYIAGGHGLQNGQKVVFNVTSGSAPTGINNGGTYYAIVQDSEYLRLASTTGNATAGINSISDPARPLTTAQYNLTVSSVAGRVAAAGTIGISTGTSSVVTGYSTKFLSTYKVGDNLILRGSGTPPQYVVGEISSVVNDTKIQLASSPGIVTSNCPHYVDTKINVRADGEFLHRPFDGGVEITAGTSPDSQIVRQTRKYFRYQSGKGIQCSVAINFNPFRPVRLASGSGTSVTMETEYPHGLVVGNTVKIEGAEQQASYTPSTASYNPSTGDLTITINSHGFQVGEYISLLENSLTFTCNLDSNATNHSYPRSSDPAGGENRLEIKSVTTNTFVVNVGSSTYSGTHTFVSASANAVTHYDISNPYNGTYTITAATDFTFSYTASGSVSVANPTGYIQYVISRYSNAGVRCGLFDFQNGFFYEYNGKTLYAVRRSSVQQLSGTVNPVKNSNVVFGSSTRFLDQIDEKDMIVIRGQSYKVTSIRSQTEIHIQPAYRGSSTIGAVVTRTVDTKVAQSDWNIDKCDGTGPSGFDLDINKIQMAYFDYSWYGAGKIRFGFKDSLGKVRYMHEFIHNNRLNESYMRSGNIPARYEVFNKGIPSYVPSLFHWGTSVIMDGRFDDDDSYLFTASGKSLTFTNGAVTTATVTQAGTVVSQRASGGSNNYYLRIGFATADATKFPSGVPLYTTDGQLSGQTVNYTQYGSGVFYAFIFLNQGYVAPATYPIVPVSTVVSIGGQSGGTTVDLNSLIPLISVRLAPSVDNNLIGSLGERDVINRMQLKMKELGISVTHDSTITVLLNANVSSTSYSNIGAPSLSQYVAHSAGDTIDGGIVIYQFRASGGTQKTNGKRFSNTSTFSLDGLSDLGNSMLGGDSVFPNGPDLLTICTSVVESSEVDTTSSYQVSSRVSWSESQA